MDKALTSRSNGALWVQPYGPNTKPEYLGCNDLGDIAEAAGSVDLLRCIQPNGKWKTVGSKQSPPDPVSFSIDSLTFGARDWLEKINCDSTFFALHRIGGEADVFDTYIRANILQHSRMTSRTDKGIVNHDEDQESMQSRDFEAWPPVIRTGAIELTRQTTSETKDLLDVYTYSPLDCENGIQAGDKVAASADASIYTGNIQLTANGGADWAAAAADPFATGKAAMVVRAFALSETVTRLLAVKEAEGGTQGKVAYSDDDGATWTTANLGGATAGHGAKKAGALFVLNQGNIWLNSIGGTIWYSEDGGASWTAQISGDVTAEAGLCIAFVDSSNGMAGFENDVILYTSDGGVTWTETTSNTGSGDDIQTISPAGDFWWVGTSGGRAYYSRLLYGVPGVTWTERSVTGSGAGNIPAIQFANELIGYMIKNSASPVGTIMVTINGGYSWKSLSTPANTGLNALTIADDSTIYAVGAVEGGTAVIIKGEWN